MSPVSSSNYTSDSSRANTVQTFPVVPEDQAQDGRETISIKSLCLCYSNFNKYMLQSQWVYVKQRAYTQWECRDMLIYIQTSIICVYMLEIREKGVQSE
ncbi:MAG: hypothetical protein EZS28_032169 [Streblomastix strix]|uniref:Uncharacterized protein n=1 Tax=Streblomastix strix TaxID=222440 RepID=A0A5J4UR87_9EUKA|nr:MAG: hypothetical protein EZS28_032169 [Streblomastix strix]